MLVQSSSITTATLTPMAAIGLVSLESMLPLTLGANIGTTITGLLAAMVSDSISALQIALCMLCLTCLASSCFTRFLRSGVFHFERRQRWASLHMYPKSSQRFTSLAALLLCLPASSVFRSCLPWQALAASLQAPSFLSCSSAASSFSCTGLKRWVAKIGWTIG